jgi:phytoene synthase
LNGNPDPARFRGVLAKEADRAREYYQSADQLIPLIEEDSQPALWVLSTIYRQLLEKIAARQYDVFNGKVSLSRGEKLKVLAKGFVQRLT